MKNVTSLALVLALFGGGLAAAQDGEIPQKELSPNALRIAAQRICPVTGEQLGTRGDPVQVRVGEESVFLCCKACLGKKIAPEHWATIHANYAAAQGMCPVMKKPLPKNPKWTIVGGRIVYVCCPPCIAKIEADPKTFLESVDGYYATALRAERERPRR